jgi:hypothetical protein
VQEEQNLPKIRDIRRGRTKEGRDAKDHEKMQDRKEFDYSKTNIMIGV